MFLVFFLTSCEEYKNIEVGEIKGINLIELGSQKISLDVLLQIENSNHINFRIAGVDLDVIVNNEYLGKITSVREVLILKKSNAVYSFPIEVEYTGTNILKGAFTVISMVAEKKIELRIKGFFKVKSFLFSRKINVEESNVVVLKQKI